jgi:L-ribulose-5-phosphate 4-epimerase
MDPASAPGILVTGHGPFAWGSTARGAAQNAVLLEEIAAIAYYTVTINSAVQPISKALHDRHFLRKHGATAYYGQPESH